MSESKENDRTGRCVLCGVRYLNFGNNAEPVSKLGRCCDKCNQTKVIPARLGELK